jgi:formate/nitrite transporter FocA (FNT family)
MNGPAEDSAARRFDALLPEEIARKAEALGARKAKNDNVAMLVLAILAGAFIGLGAMFSTTPLAGFSGELPYGVVRFIAGFAFALGLVPVTIGNVIGGGVLVGAVYWFVYLRRRSA